MNMLKLPSRPSDDKEISNNKNDINLDTANYMIAGADQQKQSSEDQTLLKQGTKKKIGPLEEDEKQLEMKGIKVD